MGLEIPKASELEQLVFGIKNEKELSLIALQVYHFQYNNNPVYQEYCNITGRVPEAIKTASDIPFLPISFFKTHKVVSTSFQPQMVFKSSGTTGNETSCHYIKDASIYITSFNKTFQQFYNNPEQYCILGLLPSYLEQGNSSLVFMVNSLIQNSNYPESGFYLYDYEKLSHVLQSLEAKSIPAILFGVTYALLEFSNAFNIELKSATIIETGGMKGRGREMSKPELYESLRKSFKLDHIHSEYGMTELLSQAYSIDGIFRCPPWMKVVVRDETDPFSTSENSPIHSGAINIIDLANIYSCSFIATDDIGTVDNKGHFQVFGRIDNSDIRGCSLLMI
jgi:phenylacetate-coenzyme A ligase PaaK-like adenylate-forming protein